MPWVEIIDSRANLRPVASSTTERACCVYEKEKKVEGKDSEKGCDSQGVKEGTPRIVATVGV